MRALLPGDVERAVAALLAVPDGEREALAQRLLAEADVADRWRRRTGRAHPDHGDGSLMAAAVRHPAKATGRCDGDWCGALACLLDALDRRRLAGRARAGHRRR